MFSSESLERCGTRNDIDDPNTFGISWSWFVSAGTLAVVISGAKRVSGDEVAVERDILRLAIAWVEDDRLGASRGVSDVRRVVSESATATTRPSVIHIATSRLRRGARCCAGPTRRRFCRATRGGDPGRESTWLRASTSGRRPPGRTRLRRLVHDRHYVPKEEHLAMGLSTV